MLIGAPMGMFGKAANVATVTLTDHAVSGYTVASSYTFTGKSFGTASSGRYIIIAVSAMTSNQGTITGVSAGGVSASLVKASPGTGSRTRSEIWIASVPTGTTGTVVVTLSAAMDACGIGIFAATNVSPTAYATASDERGSGDTVQLSASINVPANGFCLGVSSCAGVVATYTWTGLAEAFDETVSAPDGASHTGSATAFSTAQTGLSVVCTVSTNYPNRNMAIASFSPAP